MITRFTLLKVVGFVVLAVLVLGYIAVRYTTLGGDVGARDYYRVTLHLPRTGGLFTGSEVTYRGVPVGKVAAIGLDDGGSGGGSGSPGGVVAELHIDNSAARIPASLTAQVADLSAVGEEYVDLKPSGTAGPYLADGSSITAGADSTPAPVTSMLTSINSLAHSVPLGDLRTVVSEFGQALNGEGGNLQSLLDTSRSFLTTANQALPDDTALIDDSRTVLSTQNQEAAALTDFAHNADLIGAQLNASDTDLRRLITAAPQAADQVTGLLKDIGPDLSVVLGNLLTTSDVALGQQDSLRELLIDLPAVTAAGSTAVTTDATGAHFGMTVTFFNPLPCTEGYQGTVHREGTDTSKPPALNTSAACTAPLSSGQDVRGAAHAPHAGSR